MSYRGLALGPEVAPPDDPPCCMPPVAAAPAVPEFEPDLAAPPLAPEPVVRLVLGVQLSVVLAPFIAALHCASVAKLQLSPPESLPLRQNAPDCWATAPGAAANKSAATSADEARMVFMGVTSWPVSLPAFATISREISSAGAELSHFTQEPCDL